MARDPALVISLLLNARQAEDVFKDQTRIKEDYQELARATHPDLVKDPHASAAMQRLVSFRKEATEKIEHNLWGFCAFKEPSYKDDLGPVFKHKQDIFIAGPEAVQKASYARWSTLVSPTKSSNPEGVKHFARYLPEKQCLSKILLKGNACPVLQVSLPLGAVLLGGSKVQRNFPSGLPKFHVAWILSRIFEYTGWLHTCGLSHNGINPMSLYIVPETHAVIFPSFYHMTSLHQKLVTISAKYKNWYPSIVLGTKTATPLIDIELAQQTALSILDKTDVEPEFIKFLKTPHTELLPTYKTYRELLERLYGPPKFHKLNLE